jgi:PPOX class probable F420-dependent enzyme
MSDPTAQFATAKYINLETFRKTGVGVRTPVWFAQEGNVLYIYSEQDAGKVKRIRNNPKVRIAPCNFRGALRGAWLDAQARVCADDEAAHGQALLRRKYGWLKITGDFFSRLRGHAHDVVAVQL